MDRIQAKRPVVVIVIIIIVLVVLVLVLVLALVLALVVRNAGIGGRVVSSSMHSIGSQESFTGAASI